MKQYTITAQFAKARAPSFYTSGYLDYLNEAKDFFNMKSRVATNPKEILELSIMDAATLKIVLVSQDTLNLVQVSRSLRVFSVYLCDQTHPLNFSRLVSGTRLFRMKAVESPLEGMDNEETDEETSDKSEKNNKSKKNAESDKEIRIGDAEAVRSLENTEENTCLDMVSYLCLLLKEENKTSENAGDAAKIRWILRNFMERRKNINLEELS